MDIQKQENPFHGLERGEVDAWLASPVTERVIEKLRKANAFAKECIYNVLNSSNQSDADLGRTLRGQNAYVLATGMAIEMFETGEFYAKGK